MIFEDDLSEHLHDDGATDSTPRKTKAERVADHEHKRQERTGKIVPGKPGVLDSQPYKGNPRITAKTKERALRANESAVRQWVQTGVGHFVETTPESYEEEDLWPEGNQPKRKRRRASIGTRSRDPQACAADLAYLLPGWEEALFSEDVVERAKVTRAVHALYGHRTSQGVSDSMRCSVNYTPKTIGRALRQTTELVHAMLKDSVIVSSGTGYIVIAPGRKSVFPLPTWPSPRKLSGGAGPLPAELAQAGITPKDVRVAFPGKFGNASRAQAETRARVVTLCKGRGEPVRMLAEILTEYALPGSMTWSGVTKSALDRALKDRISRRSRARKTIAR